VASSKSPLHHGRLPASIIVFLGLAASCKSTPQEKIDAGQRRYCSASLDGGSDVRVRESGTTDLSTDSPDLGSGNEVSTPDLSPPAVDGRAADSAEAGGGDSRGGGIDLALSDARDRANEVGGTGGSTGEGGSTGTGGSGGEGGSTATGGTSGSGGTGDARGLDAPSISGGDGGGDVSVDRGSPDLARDAPAADVGSVYDVYDVQSVYDAYPDAPADAPMAADVGAVTDAPTVVDLGPDAAPDGAALTCSTGGVSWAKAWDPRTVSLIRSAVSPAGIPWATGYFSAATDFGTGTPLPSSASGDTDAFLVKLDPLSGLATQAFSFSDPSGRDQIGTGVAVAQPGNVVVTGNYYGEIDFTAVGSGDTGTSGVDYLAKSSVVQAAAMNFYIVVDGASSGQYVTPIKAHNIDVGTGAIVAVASNPSQNSVAFCGKTSRLVDAYTTGASNTGLRTAGNYGTGGTGLAAATYGGSMDIVVAVIDASNDPNSVGKVIWGRQFGGAGDQACESVAMDSAGNVAIAGSYNGTLFFDPTNAALQLDAGSTSGSLALPFVAVLDPNGTPVHAASWGTSGLSDVNGIAFDSSSPANIVIGGSLGATITMTINSQPVQVVDLGKTDGFVAKLNSSLVPQWAMSFGDAAYDQKVHALALSSSGNVFIGGNFEGTLNGLNGLTSNGNATYDAFSAELSGADGSVVCAQPYGDAEGTQDVFALTVASAATGPLADSVMIGGSFSNTIALGSATLWSPGNVCTVQADCKSGASCSNGHCASAGTSRSFIARLGP